MNTRFLADLPGIHERSAAEEEVRWRPAFVGWILRNHCSCRVIRTLLMAHILRALQGTFWQYISQQLHFNCLSLIYSRK